ncbi:reverse transcriptase domain-containing protein [Tanacetum coccineum]
MTIQEEHSEQKQPKEAKSWQRLRARAREEEILWLESKPLRLQNDNTTNLKRARDKSKGEVRFGKRGKLNPKYVGPSKVMEKVGSVAYKLELPQELSRVHHTFHVSNLKKCYTDEPLAVPFNGFHIEEKLHFIEEPAEIMDRKVKRLKQSLNKPNQTAGNKVAGNASNKRKWEGDHNESFCQQQNKEQKVFRAHTVRQSNKKDYARNQPLCNKCNFHQIGKCAKKCGNCKRRGHQARDCRIPVLKVKQRSVVSGKKAEVICYGCGGLGHYKSNFPIVKFLDRMNMYWKGKARGDSSAATSNINI